MSNTQSRVLKIFKFHRVIIPVILGLGVFLFVEFRDFDATPYLNIHWTRYSYLWIVMAVVMMLTRDIAYMYRIRLLTDKQLTWRKAFDVIMLWEFASSVTPSVVGGSAAALYIVSKEGISPGRSTAIVMITAFLDELFYIITVPVVLLIAGTGSLFTNDEIPFFFDTEMGVKGAFVAGYIFILILTSIIIYGVFIKPRGFKWFLLWVFKLKFLRKWREKAGETGNDIITTSEEMRHKPIIFWLRAFGATFLSWSGRFWVVNFLILSLTPGGNQFLIWARQLIMWVIMLISPTPGSSGVAEIIFPSFFGEFIPIGLAAVVALTWRMLSYYPYIIIGAIVLPNWIRRVYSKPHNEEENTSK